MGQPFILCGLGRVGWHVLEYLQSAGLPVVVIDTRCLANDPRLKGARLVTGDFRDKQVLEEAGVPDARGVVILSKEDLTNIGAALMVRQLNADVRIVIRLFNQNLVARLGNTFHNTFALSTSTLTAPLFALTALTGQTLGSVRIDSTSEGLLQVVEVTIPAGSNLIDRTVGEVAASYDALILACQDRNATEPVLLSVDGTNPVNAGDRLVVCGAPHAVARLLEGDDQAFTGVRWAGWFRRMGRVVWQTFADVDLSVKVCTGVLVGVICLSTLVLYLTLANYSLPQALYRTISLIATAADMRADDPKARWFSVFASGLRLLGAALVAAFTAIVTNYLLRARLAGALEFRRIPDSGHVIVCGLGNIGFRIVEDLVRCQERVVVIEQLKDSRFVVPARRLGVPVLIGDATLTAVLHQAHAVHARAVIMATSDDLVNLEIALTVRELKSTQRVVLNMTDPQLAKMLRESANVRLAMSIPALAAPAFVAALFGDRVQNVFMVYGHMLAVIDLKIPSQDTESAADMIAGITLKRRLLPVAVYDCSGDPVPRNTPLAPGFRLIGITLLSNLEQLAKSTAPLTQASWGA